MRTLNPTSLYSRLMATWERSILTVALIDHGWNVRATTQALGIARNTLYQRMAVLGIRPHEKPRGGVDGPESPL